MIIHPFFLFQESCSSGFIKLIPVRDSIAIIAVLDYNIFRFFN